MEVEGEYDCCRSWRTGDAGAGEPKRRDLDVLDGEMGEGMDMSEL